MFLTVRRYLIKKESRKYFRHFYICNFLIRTIFSNGRILRNELNAADQNSIDLIFHKMKFETVNREHGRRKNVCRSNQLKKGVT